MAEPGGAAGTPPAAGQGRVLAALALAQFICSFAGSNMNVMINDISEDLDTTVQGVQVAITVFLLVMAALMIPSGKLTDRYGRKRCFLAGLVVYAVGALLSAAAPGLGVLILGNSILEGVGTALLIPPVYILVLVVMGILAADNSLWLMIGLIVLGALVLLWFFRRIGARERSGQEPLLSLTLFRNRTSDLGLVTQNVQWLLLMGSSFTVAAYLQVVRHYNAVQTGVIFTAATAGLLVTSLSAERLALRHAQRTLIMAGFTLTVAGIAVLVALAAAYTTAWAYVPGLLLVGLGLGVMLTPSVNVVQSSFPEERQGEISGLSRSISNLGSSFGTAIAGTILVSGLTRGAYAAAMITLGAIGLVGLAA
ncbi:MFS transporter, partial [Streptomyces sp. MBT97]|uniref:MFS transporter n=1 Tax=Streptomyces sp. MBT97 TaxID=2800411 RepID=UPI00190D12D4